jgi:hypothetical protein
MQPSKPVSVVKLPEVISVESSTTKAEQTKTTASPAAKPVSKTTAASKRPPQNNVTFGDGSLLMDSAAAGAAIPGVGGLVPAARKPKTMHRPSLRTLELINTYAELQPFFLSFVFVVFFSSIYYSMYDAPFPSTSPKPEPGEQALFDKAAEV